MSIVECYTSGSLTVKGTSLSSKSRDVNDSRGILVGNIQATDLPTSWLVCTVRLAVCSCTVSFKGSFERGACPVNAHITSLPSQKHNVLTELNSESCIRACDAFALTVVTFLEWLISHFGQRVQLDSLKMKAPSLYIYSKLQTYPFNSTC